MWWCVYVCCQRPYPCGTPGCDKRYTDPSSLRKHQKCHASSPTELFDVRSPHSYSNTERVSKVIWQKDASARLFTPRCGKRWVGEQCAMHSSGGRSEWADTCPPQKCPFPWGMPASSTRPTRVFPETASRSVQPFCTTHPCAQTVNTLRAT